MKSEMDRVPEGYVGLDICGAYIKGNEFILLGNPDEQDNHNCDAMGCGSLDHVLIRCEIPEWQAAQHLRAPDAAERAATLSGLYNCQVCGEEKCRQPGICEGCLTPPTEEEVKSWGVA